MGGCESGASSEDLEVLRYHGHSLRARRGASRRGPRDPTDGVARPRYPAVTRRWACDSHRCHAEIQRYGNLVGARNNARGGGKFAGDILTKHCEQESAAKGCGSHRKGGRE